MSDVISAVRRYMATELRVREPETLTPDYPLIRRGVVDSIELMQIVAFLESSYAIAIDDTEIVPENLGSLASIEALVVRKSQQEGRRPEFRNSGIPELRPLEFRVVGSGSVRIIRT